MKKLLLLSLVLMSISVSLVAMNIEDVDDAIDMSSYDMVEKADHADYSTAQQLRDKVNFATKDAIEKAKKQAAEVAKKQADILEKKLNAWLEEHLPSLIDAAVEKVKSGSIYVYQGAKNKILKGWNWITGRNKIKQALINQISLETAMDLN